MFFKDFDMFWVINSIGILCCWLSAIAVYIITYSETLIAIFILLPVIISLQLGFYGDWVKNDYSVVKDPVDYNQKIQKKIQKEEEVLKRVEEYQEKILNDIMKNNDQNHDAAAGINDTSLNMSLTLKSPKHTRRLSKNKPEDPKEALKASLGIVPIEHLRSKMPELIPDWSKDMGVVKAFFKGRLLRSDYKNVALIFFSILLSCILAGILYGIDRQMKYGVTIAILIICLNFVLWPLQNHICTFTPISWGGYRSISIGILINYGYAYIFYHFQLHQVSNSSECGINVLFNSFIIPIIISYGYGIFA